MAEDLTTKILFALSDLKAIVSANGATLLSIEKTLSETKSTVATNTQEISDLKEYQDKQKGIGTLVFGSGALSGIVTAFIFKYLIH